MTVSGAWGAYIAEGAERKRRLTNLEDTLVSCALNTAIMTAAFAAPISPIIPAAILLLLNILLY